MLLILEILLVFLLLLVFFLIGLFELDRVEQGCGLLMVLLLLHI